MGWVHDRGMTRAAQDRTLVLLRHAKAEQRGWDNDHERELTGRGRRDATAAGHWLVEHGIGVDEVLCSTSERTQQTTESVWASGCPETEVHLDRRIYLATPERLLEVIHEADEDADVLMVVGTPPASRRSPSCSATARAASRGTARWPRGSRPPRWRCCSTRAGGPTSPSVTPVSSASTSAATGPPS